MSTEPNHVSLSLVADVLKVLEEHGFKLPESEPERHAAFGMTYLAIGKLAAAYQGADNPSATPQLNN